MSHSGEIALLQKQVNQLKRALVFLGALGIAGFAMANKRGQSSLLIEDQGGKPRAELAVDAKGKAALKFYDRYGQTPLSRRPDLALVPRPRVTGKEISMTMTEEIRSAYAERARRLSVLKAIARAALEAEARARTLAADPEFSALLDRVQAGHLSLADLEAATKRDMVALVMAEMDAA